MEGECWLARVRRKEWSEERHKERLRAWKEELEQREMEGDALRGKSEVITLVHVEQREVAQHHAAALQGKYTSVPPQIIATVWLSLLQVQILSVYLHELSALHTWWEQQQDPPCIIRTGHMLSNHCALADYTLPLNILSDGSLSVYSSKSRFLLEVCTPHRILALGNILSCVGIQVSGISLVSGQGTFCIAALAPFPVGWWSDASNSIFYFNFKNHKVVLCITIN